MGVDNMLSRTIVGFFLLLVLFSAGYMVSDQYAADIYPEAQGDTWCASDWAKRIDINVDNTAGSALTDYQVYVNLSSNPINETSLRVYNKTDCTLRPHWCENITGGNCYALWVNYSSITASSWCNDTSMYYDNSSVSSVNSGTNTFEFFEDFNEYAETKGNFTLLSSIPENKDQCGFEECGGLLYAVGGYNGTASTNTVYAYNITTNTWAQKANAPVSVQSPVLRAVNGKLYLIGGLDNSDGYVIKDTYEYNPTTDTWTQKADMPTAREDMASAVVNNKIYVIGGLYQGGGAAHKVGDVDVYDPATNTWDDTLDDMPDERCLGDFGASYDGIIYLVSACTSYPAGYPTIVSSARVDAYNVSADTWTQKAGMPHPRSYKEVEEVDGKLWVVGGGTTSASVSVNYVDIYDIATNTWESGTPYPLSRSGIGLAEYNGLIYCAGGRVTTSSTAVNTVYALDPTDSVVDALNLDKWTETHTEGSFTEGDSIIILSATSGLGVYSLTTKTGYSQNTILRMKCKFEVTTALYQLTRGGWCLSSGFALAKDSNQILSSAGTCYVQCGDGTSYSSNVIAESNFGDWSIYEIARLGTSTNVYKDGALVNNCPYDLNGNRYISLYVRDSERKTHSDWVLVREYTASEPSTALGTEEDQPPTQFSQSVKTGKWQYIANVNATAQYPWQLNATLGNNVSYINIWNATAQRWNATWIEAWNNTVTAQVALGDGCLIYFAQDDTLTRDNCTGSVDWSFPAATGHYHTGLDYNGTRTLAQINASIASTNMNQLVYTNETGTQWTYTYGSATNGAIEVKQGQAFWVRTIGAIEKARSW